ncbi:MAG: Spy/CpxP family protein refolding chaperone [Saprospiraceae bacterium]|nr:Spy/CpxP family protein refolding chaperone [Pyrinomonadaceae bacterium]
MSLKTRFFSIAALAIATVSFSTFVSAQETPPNASDSVQSQEKRDRKAHGKRGGHDKGMRHGGMRGLRGIDLTDAQKEQLRVIRESNRPNEGLRQEMKTIAQAKRDGTITQEQQDRLKALRSQGREKAETLRLQIEGILTTDQRQQLETRNAEMQKKREERRQLRQQNKPMAEKPTDN